MFLLTTTWHLCCCKIFTQLTNKLSWRKALLPKKCAHWLAYTKKQNQNPKYGNNCRQNGSQKYRQSHRQTMTNRKWINLSKNGGQKHPQSTSIILGEFSTNLLCGHRPPSNYQILWGIGDDFYVWKVFHVENKRAAGVVTGCDEHFNCFI